MENKVNSEATKKHKKKCVFVLALGGTIASLSNQQANEFYNKPSRNINELLASLPIDEEKITVVSEQILQKISHEITHEELLLVARKINDLAKNDGIDGIVVTQGTNSIEETAYFINLVINTQKNIVFTGSFRPSNALGFDGARNLYNAIYLACSAGISQMGVVLTFNDCIVNARDATKQNPSILSDLSINGAGLIGFIQGQEPYTQHIGRYRHTYQSEFSINNVIQLPKVFIIYGHLGIDTTFIEAAIESGAKGIISAGMGKGYQPSALTKGLAQASKKGIHVVRCSRSGQGIVNRDPEQDDQHGFIVGSSLNPQKARILLSVAILHTKNRVDIQRIFNEY